MSHQFTLELPDDVYEPLAKAAMAAGQPLDEWILARLRPLAEEQQAIPESDQEKAMAELMAFAGCVDSGEPNAADNERIDADLARAYGNVLEEEGI